MIVIDTHVWIWWIDDDPRLNRRVRDMIDAEDDVRISAVSLLEIATSVSLGRLVLKPTPQHWLTMAQTPVQLRIEPLSDTLCLESVNLPGEFHRDPADRVIVALTRLLNAELVTADGKILRYGGVRTIAAA